MGSGGYDFISRSARSNNLGYTTKTVKELTSKHLNEKMSCNGVTLRESRDSEEHPNSIAIIIALDVTGSMGYIPGELIKEGLPTIVKTLLDAGILDPQILFMAVGDHYCDRSPLQIGQFESSDELLDYWLTNVWLEEGGGGNNGESYSLAHLFAGFNTSIDCFEKRGQKGFLFTIGDENLHRNYERKYLESIFGSNGVEFKDFSSSELIDKAKEKYNVYHLDVSKGAKYWEHLGENHIKNVNYKEISKIIPQLIIGNINRSVINTSDISEESLSVVTDKTNNLLDQILNL